MEDFHNAAMRLFHLLFTSSPNSFIPVKSSLSPRHEQEILTFLLNLVQRNGSIPPKKEKSTSIMASPQNEVESDDDDEEEEDDDDDEDEYSESYSDEEEEEYDDEEGEEEEEEDDDDTGIHYMYLVIHSFY